MRHVAVALMLTPSLACQRDDVQPCADPLVLTLDVSGGTGAIPGDPYVCLGFDGAGLEGRTIEAIRWTVPGGVHHATVFATAEPQPRVTACDRMPADAVPLHVWAPGGDDLSFRHDTGLMLPPGSRQLLVEMHLASLDQTLTSPPTVSICSRTQAPVNLATWLGLAAPVPAIRPWQRETSTGTCRTAAPIHLLSTWPHMHARGVEFHGAAVSDGRRTALVDVSPWSIGDQRSHPLDLDVPAAATLETRCVWQNDSGAYVLPGREATNEMCVQGVIGYPAAAMRCVEDAP
jgi:hypothetical protein